ncbi:HlyD family efflux transporter periplasmic adaptor subunit [Ginsengibacter hankyongi]|uniref:HlyD family efflux transporter periplasmic adaptor subunit n=1 Tax=Ginsengibacter hankyongi TaxID=2607284 RepID=A0A5J5IH69_9BACT|nr:HlyD family efflux transporter periplasmic adaptor subunit [Ginsengibacter hankyongi]KAA9036621.1 HlyD family efflux transporter periplasmic adaptor subunit [Ginsengibacter hankyongi]
MKTKILITASFIFSLVACNNNNRKFDASGTFEVDEVIVSSEIPGKILSFNVHEGDSIPKNKVVGEIDAENLSLQKEQVEATIQALSEKKADVLPQVSLLQKQLAVQQSQLKNLLHEKTRFENLLKQDAATGKQVDDINAQVDVAQKQIAVTQQQINVQRNTVSTQNRSIMSAGKPLEKQVAEINDKIQKSNIVNPIAGTVITKYAEEGELTSAGKALYEIADLSEMTLRAYISGTQLSQVKLNQTVQVFVDNGADKYKEMNGIVTWISDKAEFTPKTIQTKDERANLVYAIKIKVKNDGYLKIGMYGEVSFNPKS